MILSYIFAVLLIAFLGFVIVKNIIGVVNKIKERKQQKNSAIQTAVEVQTDIADEIDKK